MKLRRLAGFAALASILTASHAAAQLEALRFAELPAVGAWAEYQVTRRNQSMRMITSQRVSLIARTQAGGEEYYWLQLEMESDDYGTKRVPIVTQLAFSAKDVAERRDFFRKLRELVVQIGDAPAFRIPRALLELGVEKGLVTGGSAGAGTEVEYAFRELETERLETPAGSFSCEHRKGLGKAELVLSTENTERYPVDSILELWSSSEVPFGLVRQVTKQTGAGPADGQLELRVDSEEIVELLAFGTGAGSAIRTPVQEYDPARATELVPGQEAPGKR